MKESAILVLKPLTEQSIKEKQVWVFSMDKLEGFHSGIDEFVPRLNGPADYIELPFAQNRVRFYHVDWKPYMLLPSASKNWAAVNWDKVHLAILGELCGESLYTHIAVTESPKEDPFKEDYQWKK